MLPPLLFSVKLDAPNIFLMRQLLDKREIELQKIVGQHYFLGSFLLVHQCQEIMAHHCQISPRQTVFLRLFIQVLQIWIDQTNVIHIQINGTLHLFHAQQKLGRIPYLLRPRLPYTHPFVYNNIFIYAPKLLM